MPPTNDEKSLSVSDFATVYNQWLIELVNIEKSLMNKAEDTQLLQNSLNEEAETLKGISEKLLPLQIEQNYTEERLMLLLKEQEELERDILKLDDVVQSYVDIDDEEHVEDYPEIIETVDTEMENVKENLRIIVDRLNTKMSQYDKNSSPFLIYCTIMDRFADALQLLEMSSVEIERKLEEK